MRICGFCQKQIKPPDCPICGGKPFWYTTMNFKSFDYHYRCSHYVGWVSPLTSTVVFRGKHQAEKLLESNEMAFGIQIDTTTFTDWVIRKRKWLVESKRCDCMINSICEIFLPDGLDWLCEYIIWRCSSVEGQPYDHEKIKSIAMLVLLS